MMTTSDLNTLRTALLITLSILLVVVLWRRLRRQVLATDMPAPLHAELVELEVAYHPARLLVVIDVPSEQTIGTDLLDAGHRSMHILEARTLQKGRHTFAQQLPELVDGMYFLEMTTSTQRTVRQFRLQQV